MLYIYLLTVVQFHVFFVAFMPEAVRATLHPIVDVQGKKPLLMMATSLGLLTSLWNGTLCHSVLQEQRPLTANTLLLLNTLVTHICDMLLLYISFILEITIPEGGSMNGTAVLAQDEGCNYIRRLSVTRSLGIPLKTATHCATNTLANAICLYVTSLHFDRGAGSQGISKSRAWDIVGVSWIFSTAMMFYPMIVSCTGERIFHLVLYSWLSYVLLALGLTMFFSFASCARPICSNYRLMGLRSRLQGLFLQLQALILAATLLPLPVHELMVLFKSNDMHILPEEQMLERMEQDSSKRTAFQCLPFLFYMISPMLLLAANKDTREEITEPRRPASSKVSFSNSVQIKRFPRESAEQDESSKSSPGSVRARSIFGHF